MQRVMSRNGYTYVEGNTVNYTDPSGEFVWLYFLAKAAIGAGAGAVLNAIVYDAAARGDCGCGYQDWASTTDRAQFILEGAAWGGIGGALFEVGAAARVLVGAAGVVTGAQAVANRLPNILEDVIAGREINKCEALEAALGALGIVVGQRLVRSNFPGAVREVRELPRNIQRTVNELRGGSGGPSNQPAPSSPQFTYQRSNLQHEYDAHASQFGITGNRNNQTLQAFANALERHIQNADNVIRGTYRGTQQVIHYFDSRTRLWVATTPSGELVAAWRLSPAQQAALFGNGNVQ